VFTVNEDLIKVNDSTQLDDDLTHEQTQDNDVDSQDDDTQHWLMTHHKLVVVYKVR